MSETPLQRTSTIFLQAVVFLVGIGALAFLLVEPQFEGVNAHATFFEIYFKDPFLAYAYIASIPFFVALFQAFKVLGYAGYPTLFSPAALKALRTIQWCAVAMIGFVVVGEIFVMAGNGDERPPALFMGMLITLGAMVMAATAATLERIVQHHPK
jgi:hypothetical protein